MDAPPIRYRSGIDPGRSLSAKELPPMTSPKARARLQKVTDGRSTWARRHRQLAAGFAADLGPEPSAIDRALVDHAATVALEAEQMKAAQLNDEAVDIEQLVRLTNSLTRLRIELGKRSAAKADRPPTVQELHDLVRRSKESDDE
jgi:hypothetical protein